MLEIHKSKAGKEEKLVGLTYSKRWNVMDFLGKYHLSRFENKTLPLPGTQIKVERDHIKAKQNDLDRFQRDLKKRSQARIHKNVMMMKMVEFSADIFFDTVIGSQIRASEEILNEREQLLDYTAKRYDSMAEVEEFFDNVRNGRHHFIAHAIRNGYRSIDYQERDQGDTCLHIASRNGFPKCAEELLLYKAEPDVKNNRGEFPIHCAWFFWKYHKYRTKEEREDQENRTCELLMHILSFGGFVDAQDLQGDTPLHMACRHKNLRTVKLLLFFRANPLMLNRQGLSPLDVAAKHNRQEIHGLLTLFISLEKKLQQFDFSVLWQKFLHDSLATISDERDASKVLFELAMDEKVQAVSRGSQSRSGMIAIDDDLLRRAFTESLDNRFDIKPWDPDWKGFVAEYMANKGKMDSLDGSSNDVFLPKPGFDEDPRSQMGTRGQSRRQSRGATPGKQRKLPPMPVPDTRPKSAYQAELFHSVADGLLSSPARDRHGDSLSPLRSRAGRTALSRSPSRQNLTATSPSHSLTSQGSPVKIQTILSDQSSRDSADYSIDFVPIAQTARSDTSDLTLGTSRIIDDGATTPAPMLGLVPDSARSVVSSSSEVSRGRTRERRGSAGDIGADTSRLSVTGDREFSSSRQRRRSFDNSSRESARRGSQDSFQGISEAAVSSRPAVVRRGSAESRRGSAGTSQQVLPLHAPTDAEHTGTHQMAAPIDATPHRIARMHRKQLEKQSRKANADLSLRPKVVKSLSFYGPVDTAAADETQVQNNVSDTTIASDTADSIDAEERSPNPPLSRMGSRMGSRMNLTTAGSDNSLNTTNSNLGASGQNWDAFFNDSAPTNEDSRPVSQLRERNLRCAYAVGLDGKFAASTKRSATASKLLVSHRKPEAALRGTEEELSVLRAITTQGKDFDEYDTSIQLMPKHLRVMLTEAPLEINVLGEYQPRIVEYKSKERDELFSRLSAKPTPLQTPSTAHGSRDKSRVRSSGSNGKSGFDNDLSSGEKAVIASEHSSVVVEEPPVNFEKKKPGVHEIRKQKIDMVGDRRARFVSSSLLPPTRLDSVVEKLAAEYKSKVENEKTQRLGLPTDNGPSQAKQDLAALIVEQSNQVKADGTPADNFVVDAKARALLRPPEVKYGRGRLTSVHRTKIPLEDPWGTVAGR